MRSITDLALLPQRLASGEPWSSAELERLWLSMQDRTWRSLALVPAGAGGPPDMTVEIAMALARTGMRHIGAQVHVADATELKLDSVAEFAGQIRGTIRSGPVILALAPSTENPVTVSLAQSADCAVLCVLLKRMRVGDAKRTTEEIGRQHFIGAITLG
ncbi:MAG: hypothetical protein M3020_03190 [Myxococcota bacterium]|jgi:hypothetical protein|nr:hypothetical protein [Myxococcota bacterium]